MKRLIAFLVSFLIVGQTWAYDFQVDNLYYNITSDTEPYTVEVTYDYYNIGFVGTWHHYNDYTSIIIPDKVTYGGSTYTVTRIGNYAFQNCTNILSISLPNTITSLGYSCFNDTGLTSIEIPNSVTDIYAEALSNISRDFHYNEYDNALYAATKENPYMVLVNAKSTDIATCEINNKCKIIDGSAFSSCKRLSTIVIPNSVETIGSFAFGNCLGLSSVSIGNSVTSIGSQAFWRCYNLSSINIPNSVSTIGDGAFEDCINLTSITIPESVTRICDRTFYGCGKLSDISITNSIVEIGEDAFTNCPLEYNEYFYTGYYLGITGNPYFALVRTSSSNEKFYIHSNCRVICGGAFRNGYEDNEYLVSITIPDNVISIGCGAFKGCTALSSIILGSSTTIIGDYAFSGCSALSSIDIPESVTLIGKEAFGDCLGLTSVDIPKSVINFNATAFKGCLNLSLFNVDYDNQYYSSSSGVLFDKNMSKLIAFPAGQTTYHSCPYTVTSIGDYAFYGCSKLTSFAFPYFIKSIGNYAFSKCGNLKNITIPNTITHIGIAAFSESGLTSVVMPNSISYISVNTFMSCSNLKTVTLPNSVFSIADQAFAECNNLTSIEIPNTVKGIGGSAFWGCSSLTTIEIPKNITRLGGGTFDNCSSLTSITLKCETPPTISGFATFDGVDKSIPVYVPCGSLELYQASTSWNEFTNFIGPHTVIIDEETAPTCTEPGLTEGSHCKVCNKIIVAQQEVAALGHTTNEAIAENYNAPTCTTSGSVDSVVYCSVCQDELLRESKVIPALGHIAGEFVAENYTSPTCTIVGAVDSVVYCTVCQNELSRKVIEIAATGHTEVADAAVAATCTKAGLTEGKHCSVCGEVIVKQNTIAALGHIEVEDSAVSATCYSTGLTEGSHCSVCGEVIVTQAETPKVEHTIVVDVAVAATCIEAGKTEGKHCSVCNEVLVAQTEIPALGHQFVNYVYNNDATITADGTETATCERGCGATDTRVKEGTKLPNATAVSEDVANLNIYVHGRTIVVENATDEICVYDAMGRIVGRNVACNVYTINVDKSGVYIVKMGGTVKRVVAD